MGSEIERLQRMMRQAAQDLANLSTVSAAVLGARIKNSEASHEPTGGYDRWDMTPDMYVRSFEACVTDHERLTIIVQCRKQVQEIKKRPATQIEGEDVVAYRKRIVAETIGESPGDVERFHRDRPLARTVRKWRRLEGLDPETGRPVNRLPADKRRQEAIRLAAQDVGPREIARRLGEPNHFTILRDLAA